MADAEQGGRVPEATAESLARGAAAVKAAAATDDRWMHVAHGFGVLTSSTNDNEEAIERLTTVVLLLITAIKSMPMNLDADGKAQFDALSRQIKSQVALDEVHRAMREVQDQITHDPTLN
jgi:hypothetical protein